MVFKPCWRRARKNDVTSLSALPIGSAPNEQNIEKDFWVCWTLDALFNELEAGARACSSKAAPRYPKVTD
jgi:hypothetical protein